MSSAVSHSIQIHGSSSAEKQCIGAVSSRNPKKDVPSDKGRLPGYDYSHKTSQFIDEQEWQGTRDPAAYLSGPTAIQFQAEHDWPRVRAGSHARLREARRQIEELTGLPSPCPDSPEWYAQMAAFPLPPCDAEELKQRLYDEYQVEVPIVTWGGHQLVRVSVQGYNTEADSNALVNALARLLPR